MYHLVTQSPWPLIASMGALMLTVGSVMTFHWYKGGPVLLLLGLFLIVSMMFVWWSDIISEATYLGYHTEAVLTGLQIGMILFMVSEMMFFFSFFWAFFHSSSSPSMILGSMWPPMGIEILNPLHVPLLNTFILLISGVTVTLSHYSLCVNTSDDYTTSKMSSESIEGQMLSNIVLLGYISLMMTIFLASEFTLWQMFEYYDSLFYMSDSVYGSCFYMTTGFHGFHVFVGTIFLSVALYSMMNAHFLYNHHFGFEAAIWYWHSVDVVWLFLYIFLYCWTAGLLFMK